MASRSRNRGRIASSKINGQGRFARARFCKLAAERLEKREVMAISVGSLTAVNPLGSMVYLQSMTGTISTTGTIDINSLTLDSTQSVSASTKPTGSTHRDRQR